MSAVAVAALCALLLSACSDSVAIPDLPTEDELNDLRNDAANDREPVACTGGETACGIACVDLGNDPNHCGACDAACGESQLCDGAGLCEDACAGDRILCDGRCVDSGTDTKFCGASGDCTGQLRGSACGDGDVCVAGSCKVDCADGYAKCDGQCINPAIDRSHCGAADTCLGDQDGSACADGDVCSNGSCMAQCQDTLVECGGGCVDPANSLTHCGATKGCGLVGGSAGTECTALEVCSSGSCVAECDADLVKCDGSCIDPKTDRRFCGATASCATAGQMCSQDQLCQDGVCGGMCAAGLIACGDRCVDPNTDGNFCGASADCYGDNDGTACAQGQVCNGMGVCEPVCAAGLIACDGICIDPSTDGNFCGASADCVSANAGAYCAPGQACDGGQCVADCPVGQIECVRQCVNPQSDRAFCGATDQCDADNDGVACPPGDVCIGGQCRVPCPAGQLDCGGQCIDPNVDATHCGATGMCEGNEAGTACGPAEMCNGSGVCQPGCVAGYQECGDTCVPTGQCAPCGNGDAVCDLNNLGSATCEGLGYGPGTLACDPNTCLYDTSLCMMGGGGGIGGGGSGP